MLRFLSWDCGHRTLAHAHVTVSTNILIEIDDIQIRLNNWCKKYAENSNPFSLWLNSGGDYAPYNELREILDKANRIMRTFILFHSVGVTDILNGKKVSECNEIERTRALHKFLTTGPVSLEALEKIEKTYGGPLTTVLVEQQPSKVGAATNNKSTMISYQIEFYYVSKQLDVINPKLKNKITVKESMEFSTTYGGSSSKYQARKKHSKETFLLLIKVLDLNYVIHGIPLSCMDDLADAALQIIAYCKENKLFARPG